MLSDTGNAIMWGATNVGKWVELHHSTGPNPPRSPCPQPPTLTPTQHGIASCLCLWGSSVRRLRPDGHSLPLSLLLWLRLHASPCAIAEPGSTPSHRHSSTPRNRIVKRTERGGVLGGAVSPDVRSDAHLGCCDVVLLDGGVVLLVVQVHHEL